MSKFDARVVVSKELRMKMAIAAQEAWDKAGTYSRDKEGVRSDFYSAVDAVLSLLPGNTVGVETEDRAHHEIHHDIEVLADRISIMRKNLDAVAANIPSLANDLVDLGGHQHKRIAALEGWRAALQRELDAVAEAAATWRAAKTWERNSDPIIDALAALGGE